MKITKQTSNQTSCKHKYNKTRNTINFDKTNKLHTNIHKAKYKAKNIYFDYVQKHIQVSSHSNLVTNIYDVKGQNTTMHPPIQVQHPLQCNDKTNKL